MGGPVGSPNRVLRSGVNDGAFMITEKVSRLEIRIPESLFAAAREIAPRDPRGRPNVSELIRMILREEIKRRRKLEMINWGKRNRGLQQETMKDWNGTTGDGIS